jgi:hypothetical protein
MKEDEMKEDEMQTGRQMGQPVLGWEGNSD